jgi:hypothetical protein
MYYAKTIYRCYFLNLARITGVETRMTEVEKRNSYLIGAIVNKNGSKTQDFAFERIWWKESFGSEKELLKTYPKIKEETQKYLDTLSAPDKDFKYQAVITRINNQYVGDYNYVPFFKYFATGSSEFINGKYEDRIEEAFQFLIDYFPKEKSVEPERKSKF